MVRYYEDLGEGKVIGKAKEKGDGIFWIDLGEITKYFDMLSIGGRIPGS